MGTPRELVSCKMRKRCGYTHHPYAHTEEKLCEDTARRSHWRLKECPYQKLALNLDSPLHWEEGKFLLLKPLICGILLRQVDKKCEILGADPDLPSENQHINRLTCIHYHLGSTVLGYQLFYNSVLLLIQ